MYSQIAFFQTYQGSTSIPLDPYGPCSWWLKPYFLGKLKGVKGKKLKDKTGLTHKQAKIEIESWFPSNSPYPTTIGCTNLVAFYDLAQLFSGYITGVSVFSTEAISKEVRELFRREGLPVDEVPHFLVATAVLLAGRSCEIIPGFKANISVSVGVKRRTELSFPISNGGTYKYPHFLPDGNLVVSVSTQHETTDRIPDVAFDFMDTEVDTEKYFDRKLISLDQYGTTYLKLDQPLAFERALNPMVFPLT